MDASLLPSDGLMLQMMNAAMGMMQGQGGPANPFGSAAPPTAMLQQMMSNPQVQAPLADFCAAPSLRCLPDGFAFAGHQMQTV